VGEELMGPKRDWGDIDIDRNDPCRICDLRGRTERAHISGRRFDQRKPGSKTLYVHPLDVVPLCGPATDYRSCHYRVDHGELDLLEHLRPVEQARAVEVMGTIEAARMRLAPSDYREPITAARVLAREAA
jgi:hypothetical protein